MHQVQAGTLITDPTQMEELDHVQKERNDVNITLDRLIREKGEIKTLKEQLKIETVKYKRKSFKRQIRMAKRSCRSLLSILSMEAEQFVEVSYVYEEKYKGGHHGK